MSTTTEAPAIRERGILFTAPMVRALLDGRKVCTRRVASEKLAKLFSFLADHADGSNGSGDDLWQKWKGAKLLVGCADYPCEGSELVECPYGAPGDRLWVRETWANTSREDKRHPYSYRADWSAEDDANRDFKWKSARFMPRRASRITLEITGVRVERVQEITVDDCLAEGIPQTWGEWRGNPPAWAKRSIGPEFGSPGTHLWDNRTSRENFRLLWESIHGPGSFGRNDWVWCISFKRISP